MKYFYFPTDFVNYRRFNKTGILYMFVADFIKECYSQVYIFEEICLVIKYLKKTIKVTA